MVTFWFPSICHTAISLLAIVASIAESTLPSEVPSAEGFPRLGPVCTTAARELRLPILAFLRAVLEDAHRAHVRLTHDLIEAGLALAILAQHCWGKEQAEHGNDHGNL